MADRIVQMKDKNGNKCFPIAANPGTPKASNVQLGLMKTGTNLEADADGVVRVNGSDSFTTSDKEVYSASKMNTDHRFSYNLKADQDIDIRIPSNIDLNTTQYLKIGTYYCDSDSVGTTITNNPSGGAFTMRVYNPIGSDYDDEGTSSLCYRVRELKSSNGDEWRQAVYTNGTAGVFSYYAWQKVVRQNDLLNMVYPVGSIYESTSNVSPQSFLGGTWERIIDYELVAYAVTDGNDGQLIVKSKNISSVALLYTGTYKVTLSKQMADTNYIVLSSAEVGGLGNEIIGTYQHNKGDFLIDITKNDGYPTNAVSWYISVFGVLENPEKFKWKRTA